MRYHIQEHGDCAGIIEAYSLGSALGKAAEDYQRAHGIRHDPVPIRATLCERMGCRGKCEPGTCGYCTPATRETTVHGALWGLPRREWEK